MNRQRTILEMKDRGDSYSQIGRSFGFSRQRAQQIASKNLDAPSSGKCSKCRKESEILHRHHVCYVREVIKKLCPSCHAAETVRERLQFYSEFRMKRLLAGRTDLFEFELQPIIDQLEITHGRAVEVLKKLGVVYHSSRTKKPWMFIDWSLPDSTIAEIWHIKRHTVSNHRWRNSIRKSDWRHPSVPKVIWMAECTKMHSVKQRIKLQENFLLARNR